MNNILSRGKLGVLLALVLAVFAIPAPASATDFSTNDWWDTPSTTEPDDPDVRWTYPDFPVRCWAGSGPAWKVIWVDNDDGAQNTRERDKTRESLRRAMSAFVASAENSFSGTGAGFQPHVITNGSAPNCQPDYAYEQFPTATLADFQALKAGLRARGWDRPDRKYLVLVDEGHSVYAGVSDSAWYDTRLTFSNGSNAGNMFAMVYTEDIWDYQAKTIAHEMIHNMGGVGIDAPYSDGSAHYTKNNDIMADTPTGYTAPACSAGKYHARLDCESTDYFFKQDEKTNRPPGYLATHWSITDNQFFASSYPSKPLS